MKKKKVYIELLRIIASALVIYNHLPGIILYMSTSGIIQDIHIMIPAFVKIAVPIFLMISGAVLLGGKEEDYKTVFRKRIKRSFLVLLIFEVGMYCLILLRMAIKHESMPINPISTFIFGFIHGDLDSLDAYWYMYIYLGFLFALPLLRRVANGFNDKDFVFLTSLRFFFYTFLTFINYFLDKANINDIDFSGGFNLPFVFADLFFYPLIGYYLDNVLDIERLKKKHIIIMLLMIPSCLLSCVWCHHASIDYSEMFDFIIAIDFFVLIKIFTLKILTKRPDYDKLSKTICFIGSLTFGIYMMHVPINYILAGKYYQFVEPLLGTFVTSLTWVLVNMFIGGSFTILLKKLPVFKNLL